MDLRFHCSTNYLFYYAIFFIVILLLLHYKGPHYKGMTHHLWSGHLESPESSFSIQNYLFNQDTLACPNGPHIGYIVYSTCIINFQIPMDHTIQSFPCMSVFQTIIMHFLYLLIYPLSPSILWVHCRYGYIRERTCNWQNDISGLWHMSKSRQESSIYETQRLAMRGH